jgi:hypothetical protein
MVYVGYSQRSINWLRGGNAMKNKDVKMVAASIVALALTTLAGAQEIEQSDQLYHSELLNVLDRGIVNSRVAIAEDSLGLAGPKTHNLNRSIACRKIVEVFENDIPELRRRMTAAEEDNAEFPDIAYGAGTDMIAYGWTRSRLFVDVIKMCSLLQDERDENIAPEEVVQTDTLGNLHEGYAVIVEATMLTFGVEITSLMQADISKYGQYAEKGVEAMQCATFIKNEFTDREDELWAGVQSAHRRNTSLEEAGTPTYSDMHLTYGITNNDVLDIVGFCEEVGANK